MKFRIFTLFLVAAFAVSAFAQKTAVINEASVAPVLDGVVDAVWAEAASANAIDVPFREEIPTLGASGETYWKMLWEGTDGLVTGVYLLLIVNDDEFFPHYFVDPPGDSWEYDKPEVYFDVNFNLKDGGGAGAGNGHYQVAPEFDGAKLNGELTEWDNGIKFATVVNDPDYIWEYYIPASYLKTGEGADADFTEAIGFDVTMIDRDTGDENRKRANWSITGAIDEAWNNMDGAGEITFDGAQAPIWIDNLTLETGGTITTNNGTLTLSYTFLPENATESSLAWSVENGTGRATINGDGVITGVVDGTVTVTAASKYAESSAEVTITGQIVTLGEINYIRNGFMDDANDETILDVWSGNQTVVEGEMYLAGPEATGDWWSWMTGQSVSGLNADDAFTLSFLVWSEAADTMYVDFEDPANGYDRFGYSNHIDASGIGGNGMSDASASGQSQWEFLTTSDKVMKEYDVVFTDMAANATPAFNIMVGKHDLGGVYVDSVVLIRNDDLALLSADYTPVEVIEVTAEGDATSVKLGETLQMNAVVTPAEATLTDVMWMVELGSGGATISETGLVTPDSVGTVMVKAMATDDSKVYGVYNLDISWGVGVENQKVNSLKVYPNPAVNALNVVTDVDAELVIYNSVGARMDAAIATSTTHRFDISSYPAGIYFVKSGKAVAKFVK